MFGRLVFASVVPFVVPLAACSRSSPGRETPAAPASAVLVTTADAAPRATFSEGAHDYRGTLGKATSVSMHLVRSGSKVTGAYAYTQVGRPIGLEGNVEEDGSLTLSEFVGGKVTGSLRLHAERANLVGEWSDSAKKKTFPVTVSPSAPLSALLADAGAPPTMNKRGEQCLADPACPAAEAERLFVAADDAREHDADCQRFLDGVGTKRDPARGRACLERELAGSGCEGSSAFMAFAELAALRIDGVGGKRDIPAARAMLAPCFDDVTKQGLLERADAVEKSPATAAVNFCKDISGTTLVSDDCRARERSNERDRGSLLAKTAADGLDDKGMELFRSAAKAHEDYVGAVGSYVIEVYAGGSIRYAMGLSQEESLYETRAKELAGFKQFVAPATTPAEVARARRDAQAAFAAAVPATGPDQPKTPAEVQRERNALDASQRAWTRYRDAEIALYVHVFGPAQGEARVRDAMTARLETRRAKECAAPSPQGGE